jgi:hypothetical protein
MKLTPEKFDGDASTGSSASTTRSSPHARKRGIKDGCYLSSALLDGSPANAGSVSRVPVVEIETRVVKAVREHLNLDGSNDDIAIVRTRVIRVEVQTDQLVIQLTPTQMAERYRSRGRIWLDGIITNPNITTTSIAKREGYSPRKVNKTISLAFLAPDLVKAAIDVRMFRAKA